MAKPLSQERLKAIVEYDPETGIFTRLTNAGGARVGDVCGYTGKNGYRYMAVGGDEYLTHRLAWLYVHGEWPQVIDHINRDKLDNRIVNLRSVEQRINAQNCNVRVDNTSGHRGVYWHKPTANWTAMVFHYGKTISLGYFATKEAAIAARLVAEEVHYDLPA